MIERLLEQQPAICAALLSPQARRCGSDIRKLSEMDISTAEEIASALKPMKDATHIMSEDSTPTLSVIAPLHAQFLHDTEATGVAAGNPVIREIKLAIHDDLVKRQLRAGLAHALHCFLLGPQIQGPAFPRQGGPDGSPWQYSCRCCSTS